MANQPPYLCLADLPRPGRYAFVDERFSGKTTTLPALVQYTCPDTKSVVYALSSEEWAAYAYVGNEGISANDDGTLSQTVWDDLTPEHELYTVTQFIMGLYDKFNALFLLPWRNYMGRTAIYHQCINHDAYTHDEFDQLWDRVAFTNEQCLVVIPATKQLFVYDWRKDAAARTIQRVYKARHFRRVSAVIKIQYHYLREYYIPGRSIWRRRMERYASESI